MNLRWIFLVALFNFGCASWGVKDRAPQSVGLTLPLTHIQQFLYAVDLERIYLSEEDQGSPGLFIAATDMTTIKGKDARTGPVIGYYFKSYTQLKPGAPFDNRSPASTGSLGSIHGFPCVKDGAADSALLDIGQYNRDHVESAQSVPLNEYEKRTLFEGTKKSLTSDDKEALTKAAQAKGRLQALAIGSRWIDLQRKGVYTDCVFENPTAAREILSKTAFSDDVRQIRWTLLQHRATAFESPDFTGRPVQITATWDHGTVKEMKDPNGEDYSIVVDSSGLPVKAKAINVAGAVENRVLTWTLTQDGSVKNADILIQLYRDLGYYY